MACWWLDSLACLFLCSPVQQGDWANCLADDRLSDRCPAHFYLSPALLDEVKWCLSKLDSTAQPRNPSTVTWRIFPPLLLDQKQHKCDQCYDYRQHKTAVKEAINKPGMFTGSHFCPLNFDLTVRARKKQFLQRCLSADTITKVVLDRAKWLWWQWLNNIQLNIVINNKSVSIMITDIWQLENFQGQFDLELISQKYGRQYTITSSLTLSVEQEVCIHNDYWYMAGLKLSRAIWLWPNFLRSLEIWN